MSKFDRLSLDELRARRSKVFREGRGSRPEAALIDVEGAHAVLKDYSRMDPAFARLLGPLFAYREARALARLDGVAGVPRLLRRVGRRALLMEYVPGRVAKDTPKGEVDSGFFDRMYSRIDAIHARGVAHCDLRSGGNTIIDADGNPYFVDFVAHFVRGARWNLLWRWAFGRFCEADRVAVARLKRRLAPDLLTEREQHSLERDRNHPLARVARLLGGGIRDLSRLLLNEKPPKA